MESETGSEMLNHSNVEHTEGTENGWTLSGFSEFSDSAIQATLLGQSDCLCPSFIIYLSVLSGAIIIVYHKSTPRANAVNSRPNLTTHVPVMFTTHVHVSLPLKFTMY